MKQKIRWCLIVFALAGFTAMGLRAAKESVSIKGYVLDSACAFTKDLKKPISKTCAESCAAGGSPLVILTDDGSIYWPISDAAPSTGQNAKLLPFAAQKVTATGTVYERGGSRAIVIEKISTLSETK